MRRPPSQGDVHRRDCLQVMAGAAALGATGLSCTAVAQTPSTSQSETPAVPLYSNLFTRLAAQVELGRRKSLFVLDTGAESTAISDRLASQLQLPSGPDVMVHSINASTLVPSVLLPRMRVQSETFENIVAPVFAQEELGAEGLLGLNHLQAFNLLLDIRNRRATLNPNQTQGLRYETGGSELATRIQRRMSTVPSHMKGGLLFMDIGVGNAQVTAFLDTGSQYSVGNEHLLKALGVIERQLQTVMVHSVNGVTILGRSGPTADILLGRKRVPQAALLFSDLHIFNVLGLTEGPALIIGADLLSRFDKVRIDYHTNRIALGEVMRRRG